MKGFSNQLLRINLTRAFDQQEGMKRKEDKLLRRFFREVLQDTGKTIQPRDRERMLKEHYQ
jgi:aldehyde:ferredoxin oxidoreductase